MKQCLKNSNRNLIKLRVARGWQEAISTTKTSDFVQITYTAQDLSESVT